MTSSLTWHRFVSELLSCFVQARLQTLDHSHTFVMKRLRGFRSFAHSAIKVPEVPREIL